MKTVKVKRKNTGEPKDIAGTIIGILLLLIIIAVGYYLYDMFRQREITVENIAFDWTISAQPGERVMEHWNFHAPTDENSPGIVENYQYSKDTNQIVEGTKMVYTYTLELEEGKMNPVIICVPRDGKAADKAAGTLRIQVTGLSHAQFDAFFIRNVGGSVTNNTRLTRSIF